MSEFNDATWPVAQKEYRCEWCGEKIPRGEKHYKFVGMWQGDFQNYRMHRECAGAMHETDGMGDDGFAPFDNPRPIVTVSA